MWTEVLGIALVLTVGAMSPGPSFVMVARTALAGSRSDGLAAALGMGVGGVAIAIAALLGLQAALAAVPALYSALKLLGGAYLVYLGYRIWRGAREPLAFTSGPSSGGMRRSFLLGFLTQISNPKTAIVYASVFASLLPREAPAAVLVILPALVFLIETLWYGVVATGLSRSSARAGYLAAKIWVDRAAGGILTLLGWKLILDAGRDF